MDPFYPGFSPKKGFNKKLQGKQDPLESQVQTDIKHFLQARGWFVMVMHGSIFQAGFPDLFCAHKRRGIKLVEVKRYKKGKLTKDQRRVFRKLADAGVGIWIMHGIDDYNVLSGPPNWWKYMLDNYDKA